MLLFCLTGFNNSFFTWGVILWLPSLDSGLFVTSLFNEAWIVHATAEEKGRVLLIVSGLSLDSPFGHNKPQAAGWQFVARIPLANTLIEIFKIINLNYLNLHCWIQLYKYKLPCNRRKSYRSPRSSIRRWTSYNANRGLHMIKIES